MSCMSSKCTTFFCLFSCFCRFVIWNVGCFKFWTKKIFFSMTCHNKKVYIILEWVPFEWLSLFFSLLDGLSTWCPPRMTFPIIKMKAKLFSSPTSIRASYDLQVMASYVRRTNMLLLHPIWKVEAYVAATTNKKEEAMLSVLPTWRKRPTSPTWRRRWTTWNRRL